ncbi:hypothetical protein HPB48_012298 [Haemaphysalis longicornis]|uniref:Secreted protein n=1 Tax=Haemaphysalis longicornis TaxID=44386 RepID=A0A9J6G886_HAELO|nr:hypothetical protein HPB48_012298 [Haemaphysalis longicornis]
MFFVVFVVLTLYLFSNRLRIGCLSDKVLISAGATQRWTGVKLNVINKADALNSASRRHWHELLSSTHPDVTTILRTSSWKSTVAETVCDSGRCHLFPCADQHMHGSQQGNSVNLPVARTQNDSLQCVTPVNLLDISYHAMLLWL